MTSQPGYQTVTIHKLPNISQSKGNQAMKFVIFFLRNHAENMARRLVPDLHISYRIFQEKCFSCYILLTEQIF